MEITINKSITKMLYKVARKHKATMLNIRPAFVEVVLDRGEAITRYYYNSDNVKFNYVNELADFSILVDTDILKLSSTLTLATKIIIRYCSREGTDIEAVLLVGEDEIVFPDLTNNPRFYKAPGANGRIVEKDNYFTSVQSFGIAIRMNTQVLLAVSEMLSTVGEDTIMLLCTSSGGQHYLRFNCPDNDALRAVMSIQNQGKITH